MKALKVIVALLVFLMSCEEEITTPGTEDFRPVIVVDGTMTNELKVQSVKLTMSTRINDEDGPPPVSGAVVSISEGQDTFTMIEETVGSGIYKTKVEMAGVVGRTYLLTVIYQGQTYTAADQMMTPSPADTLTYAEVGNGFFEWTVPNNNSQEPGTTYEWLVTIEHQNGDVDQVVFYNFTGLETSALFALNQISKTFRFRAGAKITQRKLSLSPEFYAFLKAVYTETAWKGDLYDVTPASVPSNMSNGGQGFFRVCAVTTAEQTVRN